MIKVEFKRGGDGEIYGFKVTHHGDPIVCSAVSALTINCVNSIRQLTTAEITYRFDERGGFIEAETDPQNSGARLLLNSFLLGLKDIKREHSKHISIKEIKERKKKK